MDSTSFDLLLHQNSCQQEASVFFSIDDFSVRIFYLQRPQEHFTTASLKSPFNKITLDIIETNIPKHKCHFKNKNNRAELVFLGKKLLIPYQMVCIVKTLLEHFFCIYQRAI